MTAARFAKPRRGQPGGHLIYGLILAGTFAWLQSGRTLEGATRRLTNAVGLLYRVRPEVLTHQNLHHLSQVSWVKTVPRQRGVIKNAARLRLDGLRRSLARGLDPSELAPNESSFLGQDRPRVSGALSKNAT
jgi:hypothetical protein